MNFESRLTTVRKANNKPKYSKSQNLNCKIEFIVTLVNLSVKKTIFYKKIDCYL